MNDPVVERAVRLDITHLAAGDPGEAVQCPDLIEDVVGETLGVHVDAAAAEASQIPVADLRTDGDVPGGRPVTDPAEDVRVTGVEAAGHVRAGHHVQQRLVIAQ